jgi:maltokinase
MTARMHLVLAATYGTTPLGRPAWSALVDDIAARLEDVGSGSGSGAFSGLVGRLRDLDDPGPAIRVHGDYHLGQVMRTDGGWYVLDFEGEPARALDQRLAMASPMKDVTGMLRSLHYASRFALRERAGADADADDLERRATAWEQHNRAAFLEGYRAEDGIDVLLPPGDAAGIVADAYEIDKALYELAYERAYRPDWVEIPLTAVRRITAT